MNTLILALGANMPGPWGPPRATLACAQRALTRAGLRIVRASKIYATAPLGAGRQARYLNAVLVLQGGLAPAAVLRLAKQIERQAGRRFGRHWGPRRLDIDVLDHGARRLGWPPRRRERGRIILPHPEMHRRAFVLVPLLEIAPHWRHPVLGVTARTLLGRLAPGARSGVREALDSAD